MEVATVGNNTVTACAHCDDLIAVKAANPGDGLTLVLEAHRAHLGSKSECKAYYDSLPTLSETVAEIRKIYEDRHMDHECKPGACACKCGCGYQVDCVDDLDNKLCWSCALRVMRDDDEHGTQPAAGCGREGERMGITDDIERHERRCAEMRKRVKKRVRPKLKSKPKRAQKRARRVPLPPMVPPPMPETARQSPTIHDLLDARGIAAAFCRTNCSSELGHHYMCAYLMWKEDGTPNV